jgi:hypothetical protein
MSDQESMAICAIRYTIGRSSYIVSDGQRWAREWGEKSKWVRDVIRRDLREEVQRCDDGFPMLGEAVDEAGWRSVLADLDAMENKL